MKRARIIDLFIFFACAVALLSAARHSDSFVPTSFEKEKFIPTVIEQRDNMYGVAQAADKYVWLCGNHGKIVKSEDCGKTWRLLETATVIHFQDIAAWDKDRLVAVGNEGVIIISNNGGDTWTAVDAPKSEVANKLFRVKTFPDGRALTCGVMGTLLSTADYGATWTRQIPEEDVAYNDIGFATEQVGVIVCEFGRIKRTEDGGLT